MIPFGNETVTLIQRAEEKDAGGRTRVRYSAVTLRGCSWRRTAQIVRSEGVLLPEERLVCRIPADQTKPRPGDLLILGAADATVESGADYRALVERYRGSDGAIFVSAVKDNARPGMPLAHWAAS